MDVKILKADGSVFIEDMPLHIPPGRLNQRTRDLVRQRLSAIVGGFVEFVRVLEGDKYVLMAVNETGDSLPRNQAATDLYMANVRRAYPEADNPGQVAEDVARMTLAASGFRPDLTVRLGPPAGDAYIAGDVAVLPFPKEELDEMLGYAGPV